MKAKQNLPGSLWKNKGRWNWRVTPPGDSKRRNFPLKAPGARNAITASAPRRDAEEAAWRLWRSFAASTQEARKKDAGEVSVATLVGLYAAHCRVYYRREDGSPTSSAAGEPRRLAMFARKLGAVALADVAHADLLPVRDALVLSGICRRSVNEAFFAWRRMLRWALDEALVRPEDVARLSLVRPLKRGRTTARETEPVREPDRRAVKGAIACLPPSVAALVRIMERTGMRPSEALGLAWDRIEKRRDGIWVYRPEFHKTRWRGRSRAVPLGPVCQRILAKYPPMDGQERVFSPDVALAERASMPEEEVTGRAWFLERGGAWREAVFAKVVRRALALARERGLVPQEVPDFSVAHLRHGAANRFRRWFGLAACKAMLGHAMGGGVTDVYTRESLEEEALRIARPCALRLG